MLTGKTGGRQILRGGRAAHRDGDILAAVPFERAIGGGDMLAQPAASRRPIDDLARFRGARRQELRDRDGRNRKATIAARPQASTAVSASR